MNLVIPPEYKKTVSGISGFISAGSIYSRKTTRGLFLDPVNRAYLHKELCILLTHPGYISSVASDLGIKRVPNFDGQLDTVHNIIDELVESWKLPYREETAVSNPVLELHHINTDFLKTMVRTIVSSPDTLDSEYFYRDGTMPTEDWEYGPASYSDGTWHPEHLFTQSQQNRNAGYWKPMNISVSSGDYDKWQPQPNHYCVSARRGHKYESKAYGNYTDPDCDERGFSASTIFPRWQYNYRHHDREDSSGLAEAGQGDRRVQQGRKYDMSALLARPH